MKTLKRHFSTLSQYWIWLQQRDYVPRSANPFRGWQYQGVKRGRKKRLPWSAEDLNRLLASKWFTPEKAGTPGWWLVLLCMWQGMRREEAARLRPAYDIEIIDGIPVILIQEHPAPYRWSPKTEAGERAVPVHPVLLELGFMDLVEQRRRDGTYSLFPDLKPQGPDGKLSDDIGRNFSRLKKALGLRPETVLHSFRHNVSTILRNAPASEFRDSWIDAVLGHASGEDAVGSRSVTIHAKRGRTTKPGQLQTSTGAFSLDAVWRQSRRDFVL